MKLARYREAYGENPGFGRDRPLPAPQVSPKSAKQYDRDLRKGPKEGKLGFIEDLDGRLWLVVGGKPSQKPKKKKLGKRKPKGGGPLRMIEAADGDLKVVTTR